jgi:hypothetical protein
MINVSIRCSHIHKKGLSTRHPKGACPYERAFNTMGLSEPQYFRNGTSRVSVRFGIPRYLIYKILNELRGA